MGAIFYRPAGPFTGIRSRRLRSQNFCSMQWHPMKTQATNISDRFSEYYQTWKYDQKSTIRKSPLLSDFDKPSEKTSSYYQNVTKRSENLRYDQNFSDGIYTSDVTQVKLLPVCSPACVEVCQSALGWPKTKNLF